MVSWIVSYSTLNSFLRGTLAEACEVTRVHTNLLTGQRMHCCSWQSEAVIRANRYPSDVTTVKVKSKTPSGTLTSNVNLQVPP